MAQFRGEARAGLEVRERDVKFKLGEINGGETRCRWRRAAARLVMPTELGLDSPAGLPRFGREMRARRARARQGGTTAWIGWQRRGQQQRRGARSRRREGDVMAGLMCTGN
jgi:hypothetical protein